MPAITDKFTHVASGTVTSLGSPGKAIGAASINIGTASNWPIDTPVYFAMRTVDPSLITTSNPSGTVPGTYTEWKGLISGTVISGLVLQPGGSDQNYTAGTSTQIFIGIHAAQMNSLIDGLLVSHNQDGSLKTTAVQNALGLGTSSLNGWNVLGATPSSVTANGNRSYNLVFNGSDQTGVLSPGMRLRTTRTVAAPTQCANLNGAGSYFNKTSPNGMTFTNNFTVMAWVKVASNATDKTIISRYNGTSGWTFRIGTDGRPYLTGFNGGSANVKNCVTYQAVPLNRWVHVAMTLDMTLSGGTAVTTAYMDGVQVPAIQNNAGTNPTALIQAGNLEIGSENSGINQFNGKIAQVAVFSTPQSLSAVQGYISQGLSGTETNLISAYSLSNSLNDLNTTNANNLTANSGALATNADSPYGGQADGTISSTLDYGIVQKATFSTNTTVTVQVAEGCTIPTTGGVSAVAYSPNKEPYGFPGQRAKWRLQSLSMTIYTVSGGASSIWYNVNLQLSVPIGEWVGGYDLIPQAQQASSTQIDTSATLSTANNAETDKRFTRGVEAVSTNLAAQLTTNETLSVPTQATYYALIKVFTGSTTNYVGSRSDFGSSSVTFENSYL